MNKKLLLLPILILMFCCIANAEDIQDKQGDNNNSVNLKYNNIINNMKVEVIWKPNNLWHDYVIGPAIVQFINIKYGGRSTVVNNNFGILEKRLTGLLNIEWNKDDSGKYDVQSISNKSIDLEYKKSELKDGSFRKATDEPFFFYDIDFDNKKELIVSEMFIGQRYYSTFKVYKLSESQDIDVIEDSFHQITYKEPYIFLDELSTVNISNKTIEIFLSGGALDSETKIYKLDSVKDDHGNNKYVLEKIIKDKSENLAAESDFDKLIEALAEAEIEDMHADLVAWTDQNSIDALSQEVITGDYIKNLYGEFKNTIVNPPNPDTYTEYGIENAEESLAKVERLGHKIHNMLFAISDEEVEGYGRLLHIMRDVLYIDWKHIPYAIKHNAARDIYWYEMHSARVEKAEKEYSGIFGNE